MNHLAYGTFWPRSYVLIPHFLFLVLEVLVHLSHQKLVSNFPFDLSDLAGPLNTSNISLHINSREGHTSKK